MTRPAPAADSSADAARRPPIDRHPGREHRNRWLFLGLPLLLSVGLWFLTYLVAGWSFAWQILAVVGISFTVVGPTVILGKAFLSEHYAEKISLDTSQIAAAIAYTSVLLAFIYAYNLDLFERIPRIGDWFRRVRLGAQATLADHKWIRRTAVLGVGVFVLLPLPGSGSLGGCVVGRLIGLGPLRTFLATGIAGVLVAVLYGYGGRALEHVLNAHDVGTGPRVAFAAGFLVLLLLVIRLLNRIGKRTTAAPSRAPGAAQPTMTSE